MKNTVQGNLTTIMISPNIVLVTNQPIVDQDQLYQVYLTRSVNVRAKHPAREREKNNVSLFALFTPPVLVT